MRTGLRTGVRTGTWKGASTGGSHGRTNPGIRGLALTFLVLFGILGLWVAYVQTVGSDALAGREENKRSAVEEASAPRGRVLSSDGVVLARTTGVGGSRRREYPQGRLYAHSVGYVSKRFGKTGVEAAEDSTLSGIRSARFVDRTALALTGADSEKARDVTLTLDHRLQALAARQLRGQRGAVVLIEIPSGEIRAMYSNPSFDPGDIDKGFQRLRLRQDGPLVDRATKGLYPPGSTVKTIVTAAALESGTATPSSSVYEKKVYIASGGKVTNYRNNDCRSDNLAEAFALSCNTAFAELGVRMGREGIRVERTAARFGFGKRIPYGPGSATASRWPDPADELDLAWSSVGQAEVLATPLQMAMVAGTFANGGVPPRVRLLKSTELSRATGQVRGLSLSPAVSARTATRVRALMELAVDDGTGGAAGEYGVDVGGKTGTAELGRRHRPHAWFIGYAPADAPRFAVAVLVEKSGTGGAVAAPIAGRVLSRAVEGLE